LITYETMTTPLSDLEWMQRALDLAQQGLYTTTPNPRVGCVLVLNAGTPHAQIIGEGFHAQAGQPHAEVMALRDAATRNHTPQTINFQHVTAYVTLEPCSHVGRTPPCTDALITAHIGRVVVAMMDPNPLVAGQGIAKLQQAGIAVTVGIASQAAMQLNRGFMRRMTHHKPWVRAKVAMSLDGRIALPNSESQWITGEAARNDVQHWRAQSCAIATGMGTIRADNPRLNVRIAGTKANARQPNVVVFGQPVTDPSLALMQVTGRTIHWLGEHVTPEQWWQLCQMHQWNEVLFEAGSGLISWGIKHAIIDELILYIAPKLLGQGISWLNANSLYPHGFNPLQHLAQWRVISHTQIGEDLRVQLERHRSTASAPPQKNFAAI
jgi:diaminohydroxyphosphoribosylaminopyrimidine deaminase/5-amino-6-(5-phosphoribosylamino)uracil reductase